MSNQDCQAIIHCVENAKKCQKSVLGTPPYKMYCGDDVEAVVGDVGTSSSKFGLAGEDTPTLVVPSAVGRQFPQQPSPDTPDAQQPRFVLGDDLAHVRNADVLRPMTAGAVTDWDALEQLWSHAFARLRVAPAEHAVITTSASCFANDALQDAAARDAEKYLELMFETFRVPAFYLAKDAVLDAFAFGRSSALIAEIGAGSIRVVPVFDGYHLQQPAQFSPVGCDQLNDHLAHVVARQFPSLVVRPRCCFGRKLNAHGKLEPLAVNFPTSYLQFMTAEVFRDMRESVCAVPMVPLTSDAATAIGFPQQRYELPDGTSVVLDKEFYEVGEQLLHPVSGGRTTTTTTTKEPPTAVAKGLHRMLYDAAQLCDADVRRDMLSNIILCGGGSLTPGLTERLHAELTALVPSTFKVRFTSVLKVERQFSAFIGGSILASLGSFQQLWLSRQEYDEVGAHALVAQRFS